MCVCVCVCVCVYVCVCVCVCVCIYIYIGTSPSGLVVVGRLVLYRDPGVDPRLQDEFGRPGPRRLQVTRVGVAVAPLFAPPPAGRVRFDVLAQVVAPHKALVAHGTREPLLAGVRAQVSLQLVRPREPLAAEEPVAHERPLAGVPPQVRLQVRRLAVHLAAPGDVAAVQSLPAQAGPGGPQPLRLLAVGTVTRGPAGVPPGRPGRAAAYS